MPLHVVLIPGAWHSGDSYDILRPFLHNHGYKTTALTLPSVGAEPPLTTLDPEVQHIRNNITPLLDQGEEIVVVMHSYGGFAGSAALRGLSKTDREAAGEAGGVVALVYLTAWMLDEGRSIRGSGGGRGAKAGPPPLGEEGDYVYHLNPVASFYHDVDPELAVECASKLKHHSLPLFFIPQLYAPWEAYSYDVSAVQRGSDYLSREAVEAG